MAITCFICEKDATGTCQFCESDISYCEGRHLEIHRPGAASDTLNETAGNVNGVCNPFIVKKDPVVGRYLVASRDIEPGTTILLDKPLAVGPHAGGALQCISCGFGGWTSFSCNSCCFTFCSYECSSGPEHKKLCNSVNLALQNLRLKSFLDNDNYSNNPDAISPGNIINDVILPIRLLLLRRTDSFKHELLSRLMGHEEEIKNYPTYWNRVRDTLGPLILDILNNKQLINEDKNDKLTIENVIRVFDVIDTNCIGISTKDTSRTNRLGAVRGVYPILSLLSHSCITNCRYIIMKKDPHTAEIRSKILIKKGEVLTIPYMSPHYKTEERQKKLRAGWHFDCTCSRCLDATESGSMTSAIKCYDCKENDHYGSFFDPKHFLLPEDPLRPESCSWICKMFPYCDNPTISKSEENGQLAEPKEILHRVEPEAVNRILERLKRMVSQTDLTNIKVNLTLLDALEKELHPNHQFLIDVRGRLIPNMCSSTSNASLSQSNSTLLSIKERLCRQQLVVMNIIEPGLSIARGKLLYELYQSKLHLGKIHLADQTITRQQFNYISNSCQDILLEASRCLKNEPDGTIEQVYEAMIEVAMKDVTQLNT